MHPSCFSPCQLCHMIPLATQGLSWVLAAQRWQTPLLTSLFMHSSHSVSVTFYVSSASLLAPFSVCGMVTTANTSLLLAALACRLHHCPTIYPTHRSPSMALPARRPPSCPCSSGWGCRSWAGTWCSWCVCFASQLTAGAPVSLAVACTMPAMGGCGPPAWLHSQAGQTATLSFTLSPLCFHHVQMTLSLFVGNAIKDLVCSPRPLGLAYGRQRLKFLAADSSDEEVQLNAKVGRCGTLLATHCAARCAVLPLATQVCRMLLAVWRSCAMQRRIKCMFGCKVASCLTSADEAVVRWPPPSCVAGPGSAFYYAPVAYASAGVWPPLQPHPQLAVPQLLCGLVSLAKTVAPAAACLLCAQGTVCLPLLQPHTRQLASKRASMPCLL